MVDGDDVDGDATCASVDDVIDCNEHEDPNDDGDNGDDETLMEHGVCWSFNSSADARLKSLSLGDRRDEELRISVLVDVVVEDCDDTLLVDVAVPFSESLSSSDMATKYPPNEAGMALNTRPFSSTSFRRESTTYADGCM